MPTRILVNRSREAEGPPIRPRALRLKGCLCDQELADVVKVMWIRAADEFCLHGAALDLDGRAAIISGPSGIGKTTSALALLDDGFVLLSDEMTILRARPDGGILVAGLLVPPRLAPEACPCVPPDILKRAVEIPAEAVKAGRDRESIPGALFFLRRRPDTWDHALRRMRAHDAFLLVMKQIIDPTCVFRQTLQADMAIRLVESCPAYSLTLGRDPRTLPAVVRRALHGR